LGGRLGARVLPTCDHRGRSFCKDYKGAPLLGGYTVDEEECARRKDRGGNGTLKELLMSRRPGPDSNQSEWTRAGGVFGRHETIHEQLDFSSTETVSPAELRRNSGCVQSGKLTYCLLCGRWTIRRSVCYIRMIRNCWRVWRRRRERRPVGSVVYKCLRTEDQMDVRGARSSD